MYVNFKTMEDVYSDTVIFWLQQNSVITQQVTAELYDKDMMLFSYFKW